MFGIQLVTYNECEIQITVVYTSNYSLILIYTKSTSAGYPKYLINIYPILNVQYTTIEWSLNSEL